MFGMSNFNSLDLGPSAFDLGINETPAYSLDFIENKTSSVSALLSEGERMELDKKNTLSSLFPKSDDLSSFSYLTDDDQLFESHSNFQQFKEFDHLEEVKEETMDTIESHQSLIDEIDDLITSMETSDETLNSFDGNCPFESTAIDDSDKAMAEQLIDDLFLSTIEVERENQSLYEANDDSTTEIQQVLTDSGFEENSLQVGQYEVGDVIIIVAPDSDFQEANSPISASSSPAADIEEESDAAWSPGNSLLTTQKKRPYHKKSPEKKRLSGVDKKERKKRQNVEAARRYRDKKKSEQQILDEELELLKARNAVLKGEVSAQENELRTLKKLMVELGIVKIGAKF